MGSLDDKVQAKPVVRGTTGEGTYQRATGIAHSKNHNLKQNFVLGKEPSEYKTVA
jgi:hypothetical protein